MALDIRKWELQPEQLKPDFELKDMDFQATDELEVIDEIIGQERAAHAMSFGLGMKAKGYNIYVAGISGTGRSSYANSMVKKVATKKQNNRDYVYVYNFKNPDTPKSISFPAGQGKQFKEEAESFIGKLYDEIPKTFMSREYENKNMELGQYFDKLTTDLLSELNEIAKPKGFYFQQGNKGLVSTPLKEDGTQFSDEEYSNMSEEEFNKIRDKSQELSTEVSEYMTRMREIEQEMRDKLSTLDRNTGEKIVNYYMENISGIFEENEKVKEYLAEVKEDIIDNINRFKSQQKAPVGAFTVQKEDPKRFLERYKVNLFIDNAELTGAPVISETNPSYYNLIGLMEYKNEMGFLTSSFMDIKPGALHKANGGFLLLNVKELFSDAFSWDALKRSLKTGKITIESLYRQMGYTVSATLKPEPIDLDVKVILIGDYYTYSMLYSYDDDFRKLFRIVADFDTEMDLNQENVMKFARSITTQCKEKNLKHFDKSAIARLIEYSSRLADSKDKLSSRYNMLVEVLYEADAHSKPESDYVTRADVQKAIDDKIYRNNKYEEKLNEMYLDGTLLIDLEGEKVGQINGLAVMDSGEYAFGKPTRITASSYSGEPGIINVEREVKRSGATHDKGVMILSGYIGERYGKDFAPSLTTSITFEQNYSGIDGDSASSTELYVTLSSIAQIPIRQYIAVTGSVSQKGDIQPIGGVNEKIEGYFDLCQRKGLTGKQGVIIPHQNEKNLILKDQVIDAVRQGTFHIYSIKNVEEGLEILTGIPMEEIDRRVHETLQKYNLQESDK